ncbi:hypothetical protein ACFXDE_10970 [Kitasatospora sp. NPDC059408]|uniref:hypothetical protein n=1 Tax=Kitasatospora sp. NPDC059408 TaxID=3346823 RepID=UPI0036BAEC92
MTHTSPEGSAMSTEDGRLAWHSAAGPAPVGRPRRAGHAGRSGHASRTGRADRTRQARRAAVGERTPDGTAEGRPEPGGPVTHRAWRFLPLLAAGLGLTAVMVNGALQAFLGVAAGVITLVSFTSAVLWGLTATDRLLLYPVHRLAAQTIHRAMGVAGVVFLVLHVWMNLIQDRIGALAAFVPFADPHRPVVLGLGALAGYLLLAVALAGAARGLLARTGAARRWRIVHMCAYPAWGAALYHGLHAGRLPASWVSVLYGVAVVGVIIALGLRLVFRDGGNKRRPGAPVRPLGPLRPGGPGRTEGAAGRPQGGAGAGRRWRDG